MKKSLRDYSKEHTTSESISIEVVVAGSLQRMADSMDVMAKDRVQMEKDLRWYKEQSERKSKTILELESQIKGLRIARTRFKNQLDKHNTLKGDQNE